MNAQKSVSVLRKSLHLQDLVECMTPQEKMDASEILKGCDIARLMRGTTIQHELKSARELQTGKIKRFLSALSKNKFALTGVDALFERRFKNENN